MVVGRSMVQEGTPQIFNVAIKVVSELIYGCFVELTEIRIDRDNQLADKVWSWKTVAVAHFNFPCWKVLHRLFRSD